MPEPPNGRSYDEGTALRALLGGSPDLIYFLNAEGRHRYTGAAASKRDFSDTLVVRLARQRAEVMRTGRTLREEVLLATAGDDLILEVLLAPVIEADEATGVVLVARDVTSERRTGMHARFLSDLNHALQPLTDPNEIMLLTARLLGEHLRVDRCAYAEVEADEDHFVITGDYAPHTFSILGRFTLSSFGPAHELALQGAPYVVEDAEHDPKVAGFREAYRAVDIAAVVQVPLKKGDRFVAGMSVHQKVPRRWRADEIDVVEVVVNRCWESLERARASRLLALSEERYRSLVAILSSLVWSSDAEGAFVAEQPSWSAYTGQSWAEARGFGWTEAVHPDDRERLLASWSEAARTLTTYRSGGRLRHASGDWRWFEVAAVPLLDANGGVREWIGTVTDVHERHLAQEQIANQQRWLEAVLDSLPVPVVVLEADSGRSRFSNRAALHATGGVLAPLAEAGPGARIARGERIENLQLVVETPDGPRVMLLHGDLLPAMHGQAATGVLAFQDITALKQIEDALRQANALKDEFLATLSHELRTPLTAIIGWSALLKTEGLDPETAREALRVIDQNARAQARLIEDLVDVSRIVAGKLQLDRQPVSMASIARAAIGSVRPAADAKDIALVERFDESAIVLGDAARLQQIVWNLLSNAVRFTPVRGRVDLVVARRDEELELCVTDTGEGIEPSFLPHVFERFRQGDMSTTRTHGGLGLGLAISRHLVELHGGSIAAESRGRGTGATFRVRLPLHTGESAAPRAPQRVMPLDGVRVLVVDDMEDARTMLQLALEHAGATVDSAADAATGFALVHSFAPHVLVSDIGMPDEDGYAFLRRVRESGANMPAIALTAYAGAEARATAAAAGYEMHIAKPADPFAVVAAVAGFVSRDTMRR